ncbi:MULTISPECIES: hypothetical protein [Nocardiaceae]|uniref:hypothetical protein n=1 Tax=Nocardiaceae TaxID=85025 RepID=UPI000522EEB3|nr:MULTISPECIES: hypothetical protein [Rhodococcus]OZD10048.1 giguanylate cyclase [Rhodococcus sp. 06-156-4C]OZD21977.1 giguanylate cyclase [Rhodococcus sp. 06-156-3C]OZD24211.1 giguanylate cyclase [Rhodococcus sp. 06-156-4a]OZD29316.1 giguanylate cyclase [Rhodococcus sp. 06-156-3b]OZD29718.1 giguanylate cyclase [Rhodococcus sp. 06-156-3]
MSAAGDTLEERYEWVVDAMASLAITTIVKRVLAFATLSMAIIPALELASGYAPATTAGVAVTWASMLFAFAAAVWWWVSPWPRIGPAFVFVIGSDIAIFLAVFSSTTPPAITLAKTAFFIEIGMFVGFFLGRWMLATHVALCTLFTTVIAVWVVVVDGLSPMMTVFVWAPIVVSINGFVLLLYFCASSVRMEFE